MGYKSNGHFGRAVDKRDDMAARSRPIGQFLHIPHALQGPTLPGVGQRRANLAGLAVIREG
jgi:hypothetical protein